METMFPIKQKWFQVKGGELLEKDKREGLTTRVGERPVKGALTIHEGGMLIQSRPRQGVGDTK